MSIASKFNSRKFVFDTTVIASDNYISLSTLHEATGEDYVYPLYAVFINTKGQFDDAPVFVTITKDGEPTFVNVPSHLTDTCRRIIADEEAVNAINDGKFGFKVHKYHQSKYNKDCFGVNFVDIE